MTETLVKTNQNLETAFLAIEKKLSHQYSNILRKFDDFEMKIEHKLADGLTKLNSTVGRIVSEAMNSELKPISDGFDSIALTISNLNTQLPLLTRLTTLTADLEDAIQGFNTNSRTNEKGPMAFEKTCRAVETTLLNEISQATKNKDNETVRKEKDPGGWRIINEGAKKVWKSKWPSKGMPTGNNDGKSLEKRNKSNRKTNSNKNDRKSNSQKRKTGINRNSNNKINNNKNPTDIDRLDEILSSFDNNNVKFKHNFFVKHGLYGNDKLKPSPKLPNSHEPNYQNFVCGGFVNPGGNCRGSLTSLPTPLNKQGAPINNHLAQAPQPNIQTLPNGNVVPFYPFRPHIARTIEQSGALTVNSNGFYTQALSTPPTAQIMEQSRANSGYLLPVALNF